MGHLASLSTALLICLLPRDKKLTLDQRLLSANLYKRAKAFSLKNQRTKTRLRGASTTPGFRTAARLLADGASESAQATQGPAAWERRDADALRRFRGLLLDRRGRLHGERLRLREVAANRAGSSLSAAGAVGAVVGLSLSPVTLGASLLASGVGLGVATAGGAVTITADLSLICNSRELWKVQEIAATCQHQMRELLSCLEFFCRCHGRGGRQLLQSGRNASMALYNSVYFIVVFGSRGFLVLRRAEGATRVSQAVLKAKIQKLAESLESCTGALDELSEQLEARVRLCTKSSLGHDLKVSADLPAGLFF
ncbi:apolipoprotein L domain-containing protein 1-like [Oryctolagus cuniculus]|uniref:apolipoprotein L domain-containing protein 1-like n=1 Tax=Oryctolagus cuniculus TaxID=9986 RepID=UPI0022312629|nr:apolipoprotein L domain-containing protein 1-like [Oryctolagus cuniculus]